MIQCQFLNYLLSTKDTSILLLNNITKEFFSDYQSEYEFLKDHIDKYGNVPDTESFLSKFPDFDILQVTESPNYLVDELYNDKNKRSLAKTFNKVRDLLNEDKTEEALSLYTTAAQDLSTAIHMDSTDLLNDVSRYDSYVEKCQDYKKYYITTGFKELDEIIGGWDRYEELATLAARPNVGKSWILLKCAIAAAEKGLNVGIYSGEMSDRKVGYRIDTLISHISNRSIIQGNVEVQNEYKKYIDSIKTRISGSIKVLTPQMIDGPAGVTALRAFIEKDKLDMLCVDQHSLLEDDRHAKNPIEKAANISRDLKNLQVMKQIPIIAVSQQNRSATDSGIGTEHIAQSDRIAQDSTIVIFFEQKDGVLTINLVKSRDSANNKKLKYACDFDKGIFEFMPMEADGLNGNNCEQLKQEFDLDGEDSF